MGTVKRVAAKAVPTKKTNGLNVNAALVNLKNELSTLCNALVEQAAQATAKSEPMPQVVLLAYDTLGQIEKLLEAARKDLKGSLIDQHKLGGTFTTGKAVASFKPDTRIRPEWKSEAVAEARKNAGLEYGIKNGLSDIQEANVCKLAANFLADPKAFDTEAYEKQVRERYQAKGDPIVTVAVGA